MVSAKCDAVHARLIAQALLQCFREDHQTRGIVTPSERELRGDNVLGVDAERNAL